MFLFHFFFFFNTLVGTVVIGRAGFGSISRLCYGKAKGKERQKLIQEKVHAEMEEACFSMMMGMCKQGTWTKWEHGTG